MADKDKRWGYSDGPKFTTPDDFHRWRSRYDMGSEELQNMVTTNVDAFFTMTVDLSVAQSPKSPLLISVPGRAFEVKGITTSTLYDPVANSGIETVETSALIGFYINKIESTAAVDKMLLCKNGDGFRGDFIKLYAFWPAQSAKSMRINIWKFDDMPWMSGDYST